MAGIKRIGLFGCYVCLEMVSTLQFSLETFKTMSGVGTLFFLVVAALCEQLNKGQASLGV